MEVGRLTIRLSNSLILAGLETDGEHGPWGQIRGQLMVPLLKSYVIWGKEVNYTEPSHCKVVLDQAMPLRGAGPVL